jgi:hypothetical protein
VAAAVVVIGVGGALAIHGLDTGHPVTPTHVAAAPSTILPVAATTAPPASLVATPTTIAPTPTPTVVVTTPKPSPVLTTAPTQVATPKPSPAVVVPVTTPVPTPTPTSTPTTPSPPVVAATETKGIAEFPTDAAAAATLTIALPSGWTIKGIAGPSDAACTPSTGVCVLTNPPANVEQHYTIVLQVPADPSTSDEMVTTYLDSNTPAPPVTNYYSIWPVT